MRSISKVAILNRGEIAVRLIHAFRELGIKSVLLHSEGDRKTLAYRLSDEQVCIGASDPKESYLNINKAILAIKSAACEAVHPGIGFLSESILFKKECEKNNILFIGPSLENLKLFGDKAQAKQFVSSLDIPVVPGVELKDMSLLDSSISEIGLPVLVKSSGGGGGRGIKLIEGLNEASQKVQSAQREGEMFFGVKDVYLEKYLKRPRHIEAQIFRDSSKQCFFLGFRECSIQKRNQKIIEEGPCYFIDENIKEEMKKASLKIAESSDYKGVGTVEFLVDQNQFYFLELNTRLQVEHTVTEMIYGIDLVQAQIFEALERSVIWDEPHEKNFSMECRICAEDSLSNGMPVNGTLGFCKYPNFPGLRCDIGLESGDEISSHYDSLICKLICYGGSRNEVITKMKKALKETVIFGVGTNIPFLLEVLSQEDFVSGNLSTQFLEDKKIKVSPIRPKEVDLIVDEVSKNKNVSNKNPWMNSSWQ